jgi:RNA polymerase sporulation-specific sigma factor
MWNFIRLLRRLLRPGQSHPFALHAGQSESPAGLVFPRTLTAEEEAALFRQLAGDDPRAQQAARNTLIEHNLRLVAHIVSKYTGSAGGRNSDDLFSIGCIGLIKAAGTFSPEKKIRFSSYAAKCIQNEILMSLRRGRKTARDVSLSEPIDSDRDGNPLTLSDLLADETDMSALVDLRLDGEKLHRLVNTLPDREKEIILLRYGLTGLRPLTQQEVAKKLNISRSYVSRIEKKALERLRKAFGEQ